MSFFVLNSGQKKACDHMKVDQDLLSSLSQTPRRIIHHYDWQRDAATYGHFVNPDHFFSREGLKKRDLDIAKRPTGGGVIFHNGDLAFSILIPKEDPAYSENPLNNYAFVNECVRKAIFAFTKREPLFIFEDAKNSSLNSARFCMAHPTKYDLVIDGKKVAGAAQRQTRAGFLHQGSIYLGMKEDAFYEEVLLDSSAIISEMKEKSAPLLGNNWSESDLSEARINLRELLNQFFL